MLTPAQQKIRQELEELQVKGLLLSKQEPPPPHNPERRKGWPIYLIILLLLTIICSVYYIKSNKQHHEKMMIDYIVKVQKYNAKSTDLLKELERGFDTARDLNEAVKEQNQLLQNTINLTPPDPFHEHHRYFIEVMRQRKITLSSFTPDSKTLFPEWDETQLLAKDSFLIALKKEKVKYRILEDGTIRFWIQSKSYQY
jgi:hypothetical protein